MSRENDYLSLFSLKDCLARVTETMGGKGSLFISDLCPLPRCYGIASHHTHTRANLSVDVCGLRQTHRIGNQSRGRYLRKYVHLTYDSPAQTVKQGTWPINMRNVHGRFR